MPERWPDTKPLHELFLTLRQQDVLRRCGATTVGEARAIHDLDYRRAGTGSEGGTRALRRRLEGPMCEEPHPTSTGRNDAGWCSLPRHHQGEHSDDSCHCWGDPDAIPDALSLDELELPSRMQTALRAAEVFTAGELRKAPSDLPGIGKLGWSQLRAMGLRPDSCGATSPHVPPRAPAAERRCVLPRGHGWGHRDLAGNTWERSPTRERAVSNVDDPDGRRFANLPDARWTVARRTHGNDAASLMRVVLDWWVSASNARWSVESGGTLRPKGIAGCDALLGEHAATVGALEVQGTRHEAALDRLAAAFDRDDAWASHLEFGLLVGFERQVGPTRFEAWERHAAALTADLGGKSLAVVAVEKAWRSAPSAFDGLDGTVWSRAHVALVRGGELVLRGQWSLAEREDVGTHEPRTHPGPT